MLRRREERSIYMERIKTLVAYRNFGLYEGLLCIVKCNDGLGPKG